MFVVATESRHQLAFRGEGDLDNSLKSPFALRRHDAATAAVSVTVTSRTSSAPVQHQFRTGHALHAAVAQHCRARGGYARQHGHGAFGPGTCIKPSTPLSDTMRKATAASTGQPWRRSGTSITHRSPAQWRLRPADGLTGPARCTQRRQAGTRGITPSSLRSFSRDSWVACCTLSPTSRLTPSAKATAPALLVAGSVKALYITIIDTQPK